MTKLIAQVSAESASEWWSTFAVSSIKNADGSNLVAQQYLYLNFKSPAEVTKGNVNADPWLDATNKFVAEKLYDVTLKIVPKARPYTPGRAVTLRIGVGGDLRGEAAQPYFDSFVLSADEEPNIGGTVKADVAACPDPALADVSPVVRFQYGTIVEDVSLTYGCVQDVTLPAGTYALSTAPVATAGGTISAPVVLSAASITVAAGKSVPLRVTFGRVVKQGALDVTVAQDLFDELGTETLAVEVVKTATDTVLASFDSAVGHTTPVRGLPAQGGIEVRTRAIRLNNYEYTFEPLGFTLSTALIGGKIDWSSIERNKLDTTGFISQPVTVETDTPLPSTFLLRLTGADADYAARLDLQNGTATFPSPLKPGRYTAVVSDFIDNGVVYTVEAGEAEFDASASTPLSIRIKRSANLVVPGFPEFLSFGACAQLTPTNQDDFAAARASAIFKYAGNDGAGDDNTYLERDYATERTIQLARGIEAQVGGGHRVLPIMISYTCNLSLGDTKSILKSAERHKYAYANYILTLSLLRDAADAGHPVAGAIIVNPDFLGACQQENLPVTGPIDGGTVPVRAPLHEAIAESVRRGRLPKALAIPDDITEDLRGYVRSVNWLTRAVAGGKVSVGW